MVGAKPSAYSFPHVVASVTAHRLASIEICLLIFTYCTSNMRMHEAPLAPTHLDQPRRAVWGTSSAPRRWVGGGCQRQLPHIRVPEGMHLGKSTETPSLAH